MEKKTMGRFIATLRKANGMTQKELAEKLNVSDKAVSRWERDENAPDLSLIPVIAEIFGVTTDELLRGERVKVENIVISENGGEAKSSPKAEKQLKYIINDSIYKFETRSLFSLAMVAVGLVIAMLFNFALVRAMIGFFFATVIYVIAAFCEIGFYKTWENSLKACEFEGEEIDECKSRIIISLEKTFGIIVIVFAATLPLVFSPVGQAYVGIWAETWIFYGLIYGAIALIVYAFICKHVNKRIDITDETLSNIFRNVKKYVNKRMVIGLSVIIIVVLLAESFVEMLDGTEFVRGKEFDNYNDFVAYMETEEEYTSGIEGMEVETIHMTVDVESGEYEIDEDYDESYTEEIHNKEGKVVVSFKHLNENVATWQYKVDDDCLPIEVITEEQLRIGYKRKDTLMAVVALLGFVAAGITIIRTKKGKKIDE